MFGPASGFGQSDYGAEKPVSILMDCRKGIGLIPSVWRGLSVQDGMIPDGLGAKVARLGPEWTEKVWGPALLGGKADWVLLDATLNALKAKGLKLILSMPMPSGKQEAEAWSELVFETARHSAGRVWAFEVSVGQSASPLEQLMPLFEFGVWAIYRAEPEARIGGMGFRWGDERAGEFILRCRKLDLPLRFVTWQLDAALPEDLERSVRTIQGEIDRQGFREKPGMLISKWRQNPTSKINPVVLTVSSVARALGTDLEVVCFDAVDGGQRDALQAFEDLGGIRLPLQVEPIDAGVEGISTLEGEEVLAVFWHRRPIGELPISITVTGLPWGRRVRIQKRRIGKDYEENLLEEAFQEMEEPLEVRLSLPAGCLTFVRLSVEQ